MLGERYRLEEQIGRGGMSVVYRAFDERLKRPVAVKLLSSTSAEDALFQDRLRREAQMVAALSHPGIATVFDTGQEDGQHYLVMEYLPWPTLRHLMSSAPRMPASRAIALAMQMADALAVAHRHGLVHCDVKPDNVLVGPADHLKVVDFGIAQAATATGMWSSQELWGTAAYLAPEQVEGHTVDERTDVYALGLVLCELLTGELPFGGRTPSEVALARVTQLPAVVSGPGAAIPAPLGRIVQRCLRRSPNERFQSMGELIAALAEVTPLLDEVMATAGAQGIDTPALSLHDAPTTVVERPPVPFKRSPIRRPRWRWAFAPSYLVVLFLLAGVVWAFAGKGTVALPRMLSLPPLEFMGPELDVPDLVGLTPDEAEARTAGQKLTLQYDEPGHSDAIAPGRIMDQRPAPHASVRAGAVITVVTSLGPRLVTVPNLVGRNPGEAEVLLLQLQLHVGAVKMKQSAAKQGTIVEQSPGAGQSIRPGSVVELVVSSGMPIRVPRVIGMSRRDAEKALRSANLEPGEVREVRWLPSPASIKGTVIAQDPAPGQSVPAGTAVALVVIG